MLNRLLWLLAFIALAAALRSLVKRHVRPVPRTATDGYNLLYFWGPRCAACAAARQTLAVLTRDAPWVHLRDVNAIEQPEEARQWGVMTLPTVIVLDTAGQIAYRASGAISQGPLRDALATLPRPAGPTKPS